MMWLDIGIIFLLIVAIGFCYRLSDRLRALKGVTNVLHPSIERLSHILHGASQAIGFLKQASETSQKSLGTYLPTAQAASDDLLILIEHADRISYRLDDLITKASGLEKDLRQTLLVSMRQHEKQQSSKEASQNSNKIQTRQAGDPRDLFIQRVIARYPKDSDPKIAQSQLQ